MDKLTFIDGCGNSELKCCMECGSGCGASNENCGNCEKPHEAYARLAAYEDTGLEPEQIEALKTENRRLRADISCTDKCDTCRNSFSDERYYDEDDLQSYPRRYKCDSCYLGGGENNNFEWRGSEGK